MAFLKQANAVVVHPQTTYKSWSRVRTANVLQGTPSLNLSEQASGILGHAFDPERYLLTHATIVGSVDTVDVPNVKTGAVVEDGKKVNRKYSKFRITHETDKYINNNHDSFDREVLLKSYRTFVGAQNFCEHVQIEELSKGRILDAVIRDIGESLYVDILVATDRKHTDLIRSILSHDMGTLSMGATVEETTCTKCGNVAIDETDLCDHIRFQKGQFFFNDLNQKLRIAELCGNPSLDPTGGVRFIEASWVANPAFTGAVMRNIIHPSSMSEALKRQAAEILDSPPPQWFVTDSQKTASTRVAFDFDEAGGEDEEKPTPAAPSGDALQGIEDRVMTIVLDRVVKKVDDAMKSKDPPPKSPEESVAAPNDNVIKEAQVKVAQVAYKVAAQTIATTSQNYADLINKVAMLDGRFGIKTPIKLYRTALKHGPISKHASSESFVGSCKKDLHESLNTQDVKTLIRLGRLMDLLPAGTKSKRSER